MKVQESQKFDGPTGAKEAQRARKAPKPWRANYLRVERNAAGFISVRYLGVYPPASVCTLLENPGLSRIRRIGRRFVEWSAP